MINDFPVGDCLHLIDLGIMKKCLTGWRNGPLGGYKTKWCARDISEISKLLIQTKLPGELHRAVRGLDCLAFWKGLEYHHFLHYFGIVILKGFLPIDAYAHFLILFCAITICSSKVYSKFYDLAESLLEHYIEVFCEIYGVDFITSNIHNLTHLVDEVKEFGILTSFSAYPFESKLYQIKNLVRSRNTLLAQVARRLNEQTQIVNDVAINKQKPNSIFKKRLNNVLFADSDSFTKIDLEFFSINIKNCADKWILTNNDDVIAVKHILRNRKTNLISYYGSSLKYLTDFFEIPIKSSYLNIYCSNCEMNPAKIYGLEEIKCKLVKVSYKEKLNVFIPLLHTLHD